MKATPVTGPREEAAVPLRGFVAGGEELHGTWAEDTVPLRVAGERVEAEERAARLRLVTGRRRFSLRGR
ncbi:MAG TPA: hypothetical protein VIS51_08025 [Solirubrobacterales bacterium]